jgi:hypothetical protein
MSVILFSKEEIAATFRRYQAFAEHDAQQRGGVAASIEEMQLTFQVFQMANVMAYCLTYGDWKDEDGGGQFEDIDKAIDAAPRCCWNDLTDQDKRKLVIQFRLLLYNTISNAGTECMPANYRSRLVQAAQQVAGELAGLAV